MNEETTTGTPVSNNTYDRLKQGAQLVLPAVLTLYMALAAIWHWPHATEVGLTIGASNVFLGILVKALSIIYAKSDAKYDGTIHIFERENGDKTATMVLKNYENPSEVVAQQEVLFKVNPFRPTE